MKYAETNISSLERIAKALEMACRFADAIAPEKTIISIKKKDLDK